jgi:cbb3-type cytochrome oxidase cytochrome c subunit
MSLLNEWKDSALRDGKRLYTASDGKLYDINLQNTCMNCHSNKKKFCDECHNYVAVKPYCWACHIEPKEAKND